MAVPQARNTIEILNLPEVVMPKTVRDIIKDRKEVYCISNQTTVAEAARFLKDRQIRATGVCNLSGKIIGVVSQSDISDKVVAENYRPSEVSVQSIASSNLIKVTLDAEIDEALQILQSNGVYHLIVEDSEGKFLGMVSMRDCVAMKGEEEKERAEMLKDYAFPNY
jgi:CBS domain-containing protein